MKSDFWIVLLLLVFTAIVYGQVVGHEFLNYDDPKYVTANTQVRNGLTVGGIVWSFSSAHDANWIPLTWISHMLDCTLFGVESGWHHAINVVLHAANSLFLLMLLKRLTGNQWLSVFAAFVFALHPLHVESVAWIAERKDLLSTLFFLLAIWAYLNYVNRRGIVRHVVVIVLFCCGLMAKPMVVTLPIVLLLLDWWPLGRMKLGRSVIIEKIPLVALAGAAGALAIGAQSHAGTIAVLKHVPVDTRLANALVSYVAYITEFVWPESLAVIYPYPAQIAAWKWIAAGLTLAAGSYAILRAGRPYLIVGWLWFLITLLPVIGLIQVGVQSRADRYMYIPLIGLTIMTAWGLDEMLEYFGLSNQVIGSCAIMACAAWAFTAWWNVQYWQNSVTLFEHAIASTRDNYVAQTNLGDALRGQGRIAEAIAHFENAYRIESDDDTILTNLGAVLQSAGRVSEAITVLRKAVRQHPDSYEAHIDLGHALVRSGQTREAEKEYGLSLQIQPGGAEGNYGLGGILASQGRIEEARSHLQAGLPFLLEQVRERPMIPTPVTTLEPCMASWDETTRQSRNSWRRYALCPTTHACGTTWAWPFGQEDGRQKPAFS